MKIKTSIITGLKLYDLLFPFTLTLEMLLRKNTPQQNNFYLLDELENTMHQAVKKFKSDFKDVMDWLKFELILQENFSDKSGLEINEVDGCIHFYVNTMVRNNLISHVSHYIEQYPEQFSFAEKQSV